MNVYELTQHQLYLKGRELAEKFLTLNGLPLPEFREGPLVTFRSPSGTYGCGCLYDFKGRRPNLLWVNPEACARPAKGSPRQRSFPGYTSDRTPMGVVAHEAGHQTDYVHGNMSRSETWRRLAKRERVTSYEPSAEEAFAESARLFILNPALLRAIAPNRYAFFGNEFYPIIKFQSPIEMLQRCGATDYMLDAARAKSGL